MMQTAITILILLAASVYLLLKWMPSSVRKKIQVKLSGRHPKLASHFEVAVKNCASSCSSSCNSCDEASPTAKLNNNSKAIIPIHKI